MGLPLNQLQELFIAAANKSLKNTTQRLTKSAVATIRNPKVTGEYKHLYAPISKVTHGTKEGLFDHTYSFTVDDSGNTQVTLNAFKPVDLRFAGTKMGAEFALANALGTTKPPAAFLQNAYLLRGTNPFEKTAKLLAIKEELDIPRAFDAITHDDIERIIKSGFNHKIWNLKKTVDRFGTYTETLDEFKRRNMPAIKKLLYGVPIITGVPVINTKKGDQ